MFVCFLFFLFCFCFSFFLINMVIDCPHFPFVSEFVFALFKIVWWSSAGTELASWLSSCDVLYMMSSLEFVFLSCLMS